MTNKPPLYLHADTKCGLGHLRRLQVLEREWGEPAIWEWDYPDPPGVVVIDDYYYSDADFIALRKNGNLVVYFTEFEKPFPVDMIINQNLGAEHLDYSPVPIQLLGTKFFMLRQDYLTVPIYGHGAVFDADAVDRRLSPLEFTQTLAEARAIICSAGLTAYEALYLEKPLFLRMTADNQLRTYSGLIAGGYAIPYNHENQKRIEYGWIPTLKSGKALVDGAGPRRVYQEIQIAWEARQMFMESG